MNRTDRLYAIVEELRAKAPRAWTARQLSHQFEVSTRTIERDVLALQEAGVPIWASTGPGGGYTVDPAMSLPPLNFTPDEAMAIAVALAAAEGQPFASGARSAMAKIVAAMPTGDRQLVGRVHRIAVSPRPETSAVLRTVEQAIVDRVVVELDYIDREGAHTRRPVEPFGLSGTDDNWYLMAWCRLRQAGRVFRFDRIHDAHASSEKVPVRSLEEVAGSFAEQLKTIV
jgi:predicted DNA-binding transcriptional regulator YafY